MSPPVQLNFIHKCFQNSYFVILNLERRNYWGLLSFFICRFSDYFAPIACFLMFNVGDVIGRISAAGTSLVRLCFYFKELCLLFFRN